MKLGEKQGDPIVLLFGEVLFDVFDDGAEVLGGAPFNVAWNLRALGACPALVSRVGRDKRGERIRSAMEGWNMDTKWLQFDPQHDTGNVNVRVEADEPVFDIAAPRAYDFIEWDSAWKGLGPSLLYHGTLALREETSRGSLLRLKEHVDCPVFLDVNLRDPWWSHDDVYRHLDDADVVKVNEAELEQLAREGDDLGRRASGLRQRFAIKRLFVTRGARGAVAFTADGRELAVEPAGAARVVDTVGAGDAFSAVLILGELHGWPLETTLSRAQQFASGVVGLRGATGASRSFYRTFADAWRT